MEVTHFKVLEQVETKVIRKGLAKSTGLEPSPLHTTCVCCVGGDKTDAPWLSCCLDTQRRCLASSLHYFSMTHAATGHMLARVWEPASSDRPQDSPPVKESSGTPLQPKSLPPASSISGQAQSRHKTLLPSRAGNPFAQSCLGSYFSAPWMNRFSLCFYYGVEIICGSFKEDIGISDVAQW